MEPPPQVLVAMREWQAVTDDLAGVARAFDAARLEAPSACGDWTNRQLLVHIATGYAVRSAALRAVITGASAPRIDADEANARNIDRLDGASVEAIVGEMLQVRGRVLGLLSSLKAEHLVTATTLGSGVELAEALAGLSAHDLEHVAQLRG